MSDLETFPAVQACAVALLEGRILHASNVTAGNGKVIDWRTVRSGETLEANADAFDVAQLFVALVGPDFALGAVETREPRKVYRSVDLANGLTVYLRIR